jgi:predicted acylesterase/phospholipase RssA
MHHFFQLLSCSFVLCAAVPALASEPALPAPVSEPARFDAARFASHLEAQLVAAHGLIERQGKRLESLRGNDFVTAVQETRASLPLLVRVDEHLFDELFTELETLERLGGTQASSAELAARLPGLTERLRNHLRQGITRLGERLGAPPALVVSGGVSLGSYQAGFLYYYTLFLHDRAWVLHEIPPERRTALRSLGLDLPVDPPSGFSIVTGASAGSVNALLAAYTGCREPERVPAQSLFFQTWNTLSMETLLEDGSVGYDHAFSSRPIESAINKLKTLEPEKWRHCRFSLGATTTRLTPREIDLAAAGGIRNRSKEPIRLARFTEKFLLTASAEPLRAPEFCPFPGCGIQDFAGATFYPRLAQPEGAPVPVDNVFSMVAASGAFPTAFAPRQLPHRYFDSRTRQWHEDSSSLFADGGIYNNNPLGLAVLMSRQELSAYQGNHRFLYFDPNNVAWKWSPEQQQRWKGPGLLSTYEDLVKGFVGTAMNAQLMDTLEAEPEIRERLDVPVRHAPLAGEYLLDMSAFLDQDFRTFDFHRGMVDAWHFLTRESDTHAVFALLPQDSTPQRRSAVHVDSPLFECFLAFETSEAATPGALPECGGLTTHESRNILALMTASRELKNDTSLSRSNKFERFTKALGAQGYVFRSGMLEGQPASALPHQFREVAGEAVEELTRQQPADQRLGFEVATKMALDDAITYRPNPFYGFVGFTSAGVELAASPLLHHWEDKAVRLRAGLRSTVEQTSPLRDGTVTLAIDPEVYLNGALGLGPSLIKPLRIELGLGVLSNATYLWAPKEWVSVRFAVEGSLSLIAVEHIEVSLRPRLYLDLGDTESPFYVTTSTGPARHLETVGMVLGAGWRF